MLVVLAVSIGVLSPVEVNADTAVVTKNIFDLDKGQTTKTDKVYVVGYDRKLRKNLFGGLSEHEISELLFKKVKQLREADQNGDSIKHLERQFRLEGLFTNVSDGVAKAVTNDITSTREIGDVQYRGSVIYMVELNFLDNGWQAGEYESTVTGTINYHNNYAQIQSVSTRPTGRLPYVHTNGGYYRTDINGNKAKIHFWANDMSGHSSNFIDLVLTSNGQLFVS